MKLFVAAVVCLISLLPAARAQQEADEKYITIYAVVQQAESQADSGDPKQALAALTEAQAQLQRFHRVYPDWNPAIISYRLDKLAKEIAALNARLTAAAAPPPAEPPRAATAAPPASPPAPDENLRAQLQSVQADNLALQAKLKEALASQPAAIDSGELAKAQEQIRSLMKEKDLLQASGAVERNTNGMAGLRQQLADALDKYSAEHSRGESLMADNAALQRDLKQAGADAGALDLLRSQNDRLKSQLAALQAAASDATAAGELAARLKTANSRIASLQTTVQSDNSRISSLQTTVTVVTLEKGALEKQVKRLSAEVEDLRAANVAGRIHDLTEQRDELARALANAGVKNPRKHADADLAALTNELQTLRARLAVAEAKPVPYSAEELALFRETAPQPLATKRSIRELPSGTAQLVVSAQHHFANKEFDAAEADYQKILERDQNNGLVLANLATIELQEGKFADAEKHITTALVQSPDDAYNLSTLGYLKFRQDKFDEALDTLSRAAKLDPNNPEIQNYLGVTLSHKGLRVQAETALRKAIQLNPLFAPAHNNLAVVYLNQSPSMPLLARWHCQKAIAAGQARNPELERLLAEKGAPVDLPQ